MIAWLLESGGQARTPDSCCRPAPIPNELAGSMAITASRDAPSANKHRILPCRCIPCNGPLVSPKFRLPTDTPPMTVVARNHRWLCLQTEPAAARACCMQSYSGAHWHNCQGCYRRAAAATCIGTAMLLSLPCSSCCLNQNGSEACGRGGSVDGRRKASRGRGGADVAPPPKFESARLTPSTGLYRPCARGAACGYNLTGILESPEITG